MSDWPLVEYSGLPDSDLSRPMGYQELPDDDKIAITYQEAFNEGYNSPTTTAYKDNPYGNPADGSYNPNQPFDAWDGWGDGWLQSHRDANSYRDLPDQDKVKERLLHWEDGRWTILGM